MKLAPLVNAIVDKDAVRVRELLQRGVDVNRVDDNGRTPLMYAAQECAPEIVELLLAAGADPNGRTESVDTDEDDGSAGGTTALMDAADNPFADPERRAAVISLLVGAGADVNARDSQGRSAVEIAMSAGLGLPDAVESLLAHGADPGLRDAKGRTLLERLGKPRTKRMRRIAELLASRGGTASAAGLGNTELVEAAGKGDLRRVRQLLASGADVNHLIDGSALVGSSALQLAASEGHLSVVKQLIEAGARVDLRANQREYTPLAGAASAGHLGVVKALLAAGADSRLRVGGVHTALDYARRGGHARIASLLGATGAPERSLEGERGVASFDLNELALVVRAPVQEVTEAFAKQRKAKNVRRDVYGKKLVAGRVAFVVYQLRGHGWTLIHTIRASGRDEISPADAERLSSALGTRAIFYACSDTAGAVAYELFESGRRSEALHHDGDTGTTAFESSRQPRGSRRIDDAFAHAAAFVSAQDAFVPGWSERTRRVSEAGQAFTIKNWPSGALVRMDLVTVR
jgi:ankyrin repeat protein